MIGRTMRFRKLFMILFMSLGFRYAISQKWVKIQDVNIHVTIIPTEEVRDFGTSVACGDVNGDGFDDIGIGVPVYDETHEPLSGSVYVIYGNDNLMSTIDLSGRLVDWTLISGQSEQDIGASLCVGDVNGDSISDLLTGAEKAKSSGLLERGEVCVLYGNSAGWGLERRFSENSPDIRILGGSEGDHLGHSLALGDLNGDARTDIEYFSR